MKKISRRSFLTVCAAAGVAGAMTACGSSSASTTSSSAAGASSAAAAGEQSAPEWTGSVDLYVPASAGGGTDMMARTMANGVSSIVGNNITVVNNTDGSGVVALETVRNADPDGKTLLQYGLILLVNIAIGKYDHTIEDAFTVIAAAPGDNNGDQVLVAAADGKYQSLDDLKNAADEILCGVQIGGSTHIVSAMALDALGAKAKYVEAGSDTEKLTALVGGNIDVCVVGVNQAQQYIESGMVTGLGFVSSTEEGGRSDRLPDVPSFVEQGYDVVWAGMQMILGPKGMDPALVEYINESYIAAYPDCKAALEEASLGMKFLTLEESTAIIEEYTEKINTIVQQLGLHS